MKQSKKRVGIIGGGQHLRRSHVAVWGEEFELTAIFDPSPVSREKVLKLARQQVSVCTSPENVVARDDVDVVMVGSLDEFHAQQLDLAVRAGKHVLCEKPLTITEQDMKRVYSTLRYAKQAGLVVASCHPRRDRHNRDLPYGWVKANINKLIQQFGFPSYVALNSIYPRPSTGWKDERSLLLDKFVHDIDYLRFLFGNRPFKARQVTDSSNHYQVRGLIDNSGFAVDFDCLGTRLHGAEGEFIEIITLTFDHGTCVVYTQTGTVRYHDHRTGKKWTQSITPMTSKGYDRVFAALMRDFAAALDGGPRLHSFEDLRVINESAVALASGKEYHHRLS